MLIGVKKDGRNYTEEGKPSSRLPGGNPSICHFTLAPLRRY